AGSWHCAAIALGLGFVLASWSRSEETPPPPAGWKLVWSDEFDGKEIDRAKWDFDVGNGFYDYNASQWIRGWGNDELQYYTRKPDNALGKDGWPHTRALKESRDGFGFTSARLKTRKKDGSALFNLKYGRFDLRAKLPTGKGVWPALWMLPQEDKYGGAASAGETDIMEVPGGGRAKAPGASAVRNRRPGEAPVSPGHH